MKIYRNQKVIQRGKIKGVSSGFLAILILGGGIYVNFQYQNGGILSFLALVFGYLLSQVSVFYTNRFGRSPRLDEQIDQALKGLDDRYGLYHYQSPVSHLLVGPAGVWILLPYIQRGRITYEEEKQRWKRVGGNLYLKYFAQDSIGRPSREIQKGKKKLARFLDNIPGITTPEIKAALVFTDENAQVEAENAPSPTLHINQLKKMVRKEAKGKESLSMTVAQTIQDALEFG